MLLRRLTALCFMLPLLITPAAHSQFVRAKGTEIVDASSKSLAIHGISIGNWMVLEGYFWYFGSVNTYQKGISSSQVWLRTDVYLQFLNLEELF